MVLIRTDFFPVHLSIYEWLSILNKIFLLQDLRIELYEMNFYLQGAQSLYFKAE